jgi:hypothetical protein
MIMGKTPRPFLDEAEIKRFVKSKSEGKVEVSYMCPIAVDVQVWEVWVYDESEYFTRFVVDDRNEHLPVYHSQFQQFCRQVMEWRMASIQSWFRIIVAGFGFIISASTVCILLLTGNHNDYVLLSLAGMVASGGAMFFGKWISFK